MVNEKLCTVCGYEMEEGPRDYNICSSCGTEFGLHDVNSTVENLRYVWLSGGAKWYSAAIPPPTKWDPIQQLASMLFSQANIPVYSLGTITPDRALVPMADLDRTKYAYRLSESLCT